MMSSTLGAPLGGTTRGGHQGVESLASSLMTPPNFGGGGGSCLPSIEVVALGEPGVPLTCCAAALGAQSALKKMASVANARAIFAFRFISVLLDSFAAARQHDVLVFFAGQWKSQVSRFADSAV